MQTTTDQTLVGIIFHFLCPNVFTSRVQIFSKRGEIIRNRKIMSTRQTQIAISSLFGRINAEINGDFVL